MIFLSLILIAVVLGAAVLFFLMQPKDKRGDLVQPPKPLQSGSQACALDTEQFSDQLSSLLKEGRKIEAIKLVREEKGLGLKEAKDFVENHDDG